MNLLPWLLLQWQGLLRRSDSELGQGDTETRRHGDMETRRHGEMETWRLGDTVSCPEIGLQETVNYKLVSGGTIKRELSCRCRLFRN